MRVAKPFVFALVCQEVGWEAVRQHIGVNATGRAFNSLAAICNDWGWICSSRSRRHDRTGRGGGGRGVARRTPPRRRLGHGRRHARRWVA
jgi:Glutaminase